MFQTGYGVSSSAAVVDGIVYVGGWDNNLYAIDAATGQQLWLYEVGGAIGSSPAVIGGVVYVGSWDFNLYAIGNPAS